MYKISLDKDKAKVVGKMDIHGVVVLVGFILLELDRSWVVGLFAEGGFVGSLGLILITSVLFGRIFGTFRQILRVLRLEKII